MTNIEKLQTKSTPYTYILEWTKQGKRYIGARWAVGCHPQDLWNSYFTSSEYVADFVKEHGSPDIILIDKTFDNAMDAMTRETSLLRQYDVIYNDAFLNKNICGVYNHKDPEIIEKLRRFNTGKKHSEESKRKISLANKGKIISEEAKKNLSIALMGHHTSAETKQKISLARIGQPSPRKGATLSPETKEKLRIANLGKKVSAETKRKISIATKGKKLSEETKQRMRKPRGKQKNPCLIPRKLPTLKCPYCEKTGVKFNMKRWHFDNCKLKQGA